MSTVEELYRKEYIQFESFTKRLHQLLETVLDSYSIKYHLVESRTKTIESFVEKINRKQEKYSNPLKQITDICALRIIVFYIDDLDKVDSLIKDIFIVDPNNSFNAKEILTENQFGYLSSHYVVSLKKDRSKLPEWTAYKTFKAEIQVRTVLQHAWAAISHELEYKKTYDIPSVLKRKLFRLAGLIELADEEFQEAREKHQEVELAIREKKTLNDIKVFEELNLNTLQNYFSQNQDVLRKIETSAVDAGFEVENDYVDLKNKRNDYLSDIIEVCKLKGISTIELLDKFLKGKTDNAKTELESIYKIDNTSWIVSVEFIVLLLLLASLNAQQIEQYNHKSWGENIWEGVLKYINLK